MVERAARALASEFGFDRDSGGFYSPAYWDHIAEAALKAAGVVSREEHERVREAAASLASWAEEAGGHHGIEECAGPGQMNTEWDDVQDGLRAAAADVRAALSSSGEVG